MKLDKLQSLYRSIKEHDRTYTTFKFIKNKIEFDIFYDIGRTPHRLGFILIRSDFSMWIDVTNGFNISTYIEKSTLKKLYDILGITSDPTNKFSTNSFFAEFNSKIPTIYKATEKEICEYVAKNEYKIENPDNLYYLREMPWYQNQKRSLKNSEKTMVLYPELWETIKNNLHVSIGYTDNILLSKKMK